MADEVALYRDPSAMEPLFPEDPAGELEHLATELLRASARLSEAMHPVTRAAVAELVRPMNSYYSNLIEGHDTHPLDIDRALRSEYAKDKKNRDLQLEAVAHINVHRGLHDRWRAGSAPANPADPEFLKELHAAFYEHLPDTFKLVANKNGPPRTLVPGAFRDGEVEVGRHIAPAHEKVPAFMDRFGSFYDPKAAANRSALRRIIAIAAAHHRLVWIHPFLDGNGRVVRLFSDACFLNEQLDAAGLWSISRGLARSRDTYRDMLAAADTGRMGNHDGRGNLSNKTLVAFCSYFLRTAIDQVTFMHGSFQLEGVLQRLHAYVDHMAAAKRMHTSARYILEAVFLRGTITRQDAERLTGTSHKTLKKITDQLVGSGLLTEEKREGLPLLFHASYPLRSSPWVFPGLYPGSKEVEIRVAP
jgi:Fic family protein